MADELDKLGGLEAGKDLMYAYSGAVFDAPATCNMLRALIARIEAQEAKIAELEQELADERMVFESSNELIGKLQADLAEWIKATEDPVECPHGEELGYCDACQYEWVVRIEELRKKFVLPEKESNDADNPPRS